MHYGSRCVRFTMALVAVLLIAAGATAQTASGRLIGTVVDDKGVALPGVTVTIQSDVLIGGPRSTVSGSDGNFSFVGLAPGVYSVRTDLEGFVSQEWKEVKVPLAGAAEVAIEMAAGQFADVVEVTGEAPVIDPTQVNTEQTFDQAYLRKGAVGSANRSYQNVLGQAAGVAYQAGAGSNPSVYGSTLGENAFYVDGMDTTDPVTSTFGTNFTYDAIQEIQFQTGGFEAEFGRATGGLVNLVTKSGGNSFSGTFDARYRDESFYESGDHFDPDEQPETFEYYSATLGGPIVRDKMWFFAAYQRSDTQATPQDAYTTRNFLGDYYLGKLTWQLNPSWRLVGKYSADPAEIDNAYQANRLPEATGFQEQGGEIYSGELNAVLTDALLWNVFVGINRQELNTTPQGGDLATPGHYNYSTALYTENYMNQQYSNRDRDDYVTNLTWFVDDLAGSHELKLGAEYSKNFFSSANCNTGDLEGLPCYTGQVGYSYYDFNYGTTKVYPYFLWEYEDAGTAEYDGLLQTAYVQDAWRISPNLTIKAGVRYDQVAYDNDLGEEIANMDEMQPRVAFAWDLTGDAKNVLRANYGRFMHPSAMTLPSFAKVTQETSYRWYSCSGVVSINFGFPVSSPAQCQAWAQSTGSRYMPDPTGFDPYGFILRPSQVYGSEPNEVIDGLEPTYADEFIVSFEREVFDRSSIELTYVNKQTRDIFEDTCDGNYPTASEDASCDFYLMYNIPELARDYEGFVVKFESRGLDWLTLLASYTYSTSEGNVEYTQNADVDFDLYPYHFVNTYGYLSDHAEHRFKVNGFILLPLDFTIGFDGYYDSPFVYNTYLDAGDDPAIIYGEEFETPRGDKEANELYRLDLEVTKGFTVGNLRLELIGTVYNVFGSEEPTEVCEYSSGCTGVDHGGAEEWQIPRRYELGFRIEF